MKRLRTGFVEMKNKTEFIYSKAFKPDEFK